jgi:S1-C subfamily serine protease
MSRSGVLLASLVLLSSCAASVPESAAPPPVGPTPEPMMAPAPAVAPAPQTPARTCDMFVKPGVVRRASLVRELDAGMPRWLQGVEGDRVLANHRFQGWQVRSLQPDDPCYREVDLRAGDVVQKVSNKSIEKPEQAFEVFQALRTAPAIVVDYLRDGKARKLTLPISDE